ncbi:DUF3817 domain-containing protein [Gordonia hankookensis]|uniref:DUF3817 domain-containing protein n=1 Tax=Gordonia hankookensis TaxID=589403 RepID=A0ABR7WFM3_9ACTN|nr:DUF3817 domain-containing protein [Gordonia hankookensis]MBD1321562.1 DUF3817 domain-containing protein [Gordonia hankookensis]NDZ93161.1 DUF3817 domain-containing protein [Streptomyces sp. SID11726]NDZ94758.1 DUF3817 domain-containing protein [Streptomyces sp. SID11726]NEB22918.1 DUF3817 domain-containing protein [Streptomyces sp. SID6673]
MTETTSTTTGTPVEKVRPALLRYRVLAWITGLWLLLLVAELILKYGFGVDALDFVPIVHGWVYFVYLIVTIDLAIKVRWPLGKIVVTAIAGTIPFLSFYFEHIRTKEVKAQYRL